MNIALILSYDGTRFHGWQMQKNLPTIQQCVTDAVRQTLGQEVTVSGVGRTDAGVHARRYVANFHADCSIPMDRLPLALNARLPQEIAVWGAAVVPEEFDARFSCLRKEYSYYICPGRIRDPFEVNRSYFYPYELDVDAMNRAAQYFVGRQDFAAVWRYLAAFSQDGVLTVAQVLYRKVDFAAVRSMGTPVKSTVREIFYCNVDQIDKLVRIRVCADGFLYNMVRAISGTLLYAGQGKFAPEAVADILKSCDREQAGPTLPPGGLYMTRLWYEDQTLMSFGLDGTPRGNAE